MGLFNAYHSGLAGHSVPSGPAGAGRPAGPPPPAQAGSAGALNAPIAAEIEALKQRLEEDPADLAARGASIWSPNQDAVDRDSVEQAHAAGLEVIPWTVNDRSDMADLIAAGVDGLITDRPDLLLDLLDELAPPGGG